MEVVEAIQQALEDGRLTGEGSPGSGPADLRDPGAGSRVRGQLPGGGAAPEAQAREAPRLWALRRVETPLGAQAQHDWFEVRVPLGARERRVQALIGTLSHGRAKFCWVREDQSQLARAHGHLDLFDRYGGVPLSFMGPPGVGKSHLAVALGVKAVKNGFSTTHFVLDNLKHVLKGDAAIAPRRLKARSYLNSSLLVIDEVGFRPLNRQGANLFFRLVSARYEKGSIILTFNRHVRDWPEIFAGDEILTTEILDRLLQHVHIIHIDGRSYRPREIDGLLRPSNPTPTRGRDINTARRPRMRKSGSLPTGQIWVSLCTRVPDSGSHSREAPSQGGQMFGPFHCLGNRHRDPVSQSSHELW